MVQSVRAARVLCASPQTFLSQEASEVVYEEEDEDYNAEDARGRGVEAPSLRVELLRAHFDYPDDVS